MTLYRLVIISGLLLYPLLTHILIVVNAENYALLTLMVLSAIGMLGSWLKQKTVSLSGIEVYLLVLVLGTVNLFTRSAQALSVPFIVVNFMLAVFVLKSLNQDSGSVFERILTCVHGEIVQEPVRNKARLFTAIWGWYFLSVALLSLLLAIFAPLSWWSWFSNVGYFVFTPVVIVVMHFYQVAFFRRYEVAMHMRDFMTVLKMPLSDQRHPFRGFRQGQG